MEYVGDCSSGGGGGCLNRSKVSSDGVVGVAG